MRERPGDPGPQRCRRLCDNAQELLELPKWAMSFQVSADTPMSQYSSTASRSGASECALASFSFLPTLQSRLGQALAQALADVAGEA